MYSLLTRIAPWANDVRAPPSGWASRSGSPGSRGQKFLHRSSSAKRQTVLCPSRPADHPVPSSQRSVAKTIHIHSFVSRALERPALLVPQEAFSPGKGFHQFKSQAHEAFLVREHTSLSKVMCSTYCWHSLNRVRVPQKSDSSPVNALSFLTPTSVVVDPAL